MLNIILALNMNHKDLEKIVGSENNRNYLFVFLTFLTKDYEAF